MNRDAGRSQVCVARIPHTRGDEPITTVKGRARKSIPTRCGLTVLTEWTWDPEEVFPQREG
jgi:hypothetical protein